MNLVNIGPLDLYLDANEGPAQSFLGRCEQHLLLDLRIIGGPRMCTDTDSEQCAYQQMGPGGTYHEKKHIFDRLPSSPFSNSRSYTPHRHCGDDPWRAATNSSYDCSLSPVFSPVFSTTISVLESFTVKTMYLSWRFLSCWYVARHSELTWTPDDCESMRMHMHRGDSVRSVEKERSTFAGRGLPWLLSG